MNHRSSKKATRKMGERSLMLQNYIWRAEVHSKVCSESKRTGSNAITTVKEDEYSNTFLQKWLQNTRWKLEKRMACTMCNLKHTLFYKCKSQYKWWEIENISPKCKHRGCFHYSDRRYCMLLAFQPLFKKMWVRRNITY